MTPWHLAALSSHSEFVNLIEITGQHWHILNWPYTAAMWSGVNPSRVLGFCLMRKSKWRVQIAVQMCQIYRLPNEVGPALSRGFSH